MNLIAVFFLLYLNPIVEIKNVLSKIDSYTVDLKLPKETESLFYSKINKDYQNILSEFLLKYPLNPTNYRLKFIKGYNSFLNKEYKEAIIEFEKILGIYTELNDYILFFLAQCYENTENLQRAYQSYALITENSIFHSIATKRKLNLLYLLGYFSDIKLFFEKYSHLLEEIDYSWIYIQSLISLNLNKEAILELKKIWFQSDETLKKQIEKLLSDFEKKGEKNTQITFLEKYNRCEFLLQKENYEDLKKSFTLSYSINNLTSLTTDLCILKGQFYSGDLSNFSYIERIKTLSIEKNKTFIYQMDYLNAYYLYKKKKYQEALDSFLLILKNYPSYQENEKIYDIVLNLYSVLEKNDDKFKFLEKYINETKFNLNKAKYLYEAFIYFYKQASYKQAIPYIEKYLELDIADEDSRNEMRAKYYLAKSYFLSNDYEKSTYNFIKLILEDPLNYYAYLSFNKLKDNSDKINSKMINIAINEVKKNTNKIEIDEFYKNYKILKIYELIKLRLFDLAINELNDFVKKAKKSYEFLSIALFFENLELYKNSRSIFLKTLRNISFFNKKEQFLSFWQEFYPLKFQNLIQKSAKEYSVNQYYIYGIMREESAYNPRALSVSYAYGLMQVLYPTAKETAEKMNMELTSEEDLYEPNINIPIGTKYLQIMLSMFDNNYFYASASYNAGAGNVKKWIERFNDITDIEDFCEEIPSEQANRYVYKVLGSFHTYRLLYEQNYLKIGKIDLFNEFFKK